MKSEEIREMTIAEIKERIENEKEMLLKLKINHHVSSLENPMKIKFARRTIARLKTEVTKREQGEGVSESAGKKETAKTVSEVSAKTKVKEDKKSEVTKVTKEEKVTSE